ncbi:MAG: hypothetical protein JNL96_15560 [Planctomycetaceae bacterium]|nr:hypothetical protein [Planctomycetaceae bacterium]
MSGDLNPHQRREWRERHVWSPNQLRHTAANLRRRLNEWGFRQFDEWISIPADGTFPNYLPTEPERWKLERRRLKYYDAHGKFPPRQETEFALSTAKAE